MCMDDSVCGICVKKIEPPYTTIHWYIDDETPDFPEDICKDCDWEVTKFISQLCTRMKAIEEARSW